MASSTEKTARKIKFATLPPRHVLNEFSSCLKCGSQFPDPAARFCSLCGGRTLSSQKARRMGWLSMAAGILLVGTMTFIGLWLRFSDSYWEGTREFAAYGIALGAFMVAFGLVAAAAGIWQIRKGTRN